MLTRSRNVFMLASPQDGPSHLLEEAAVPTPVQIGHDFERALAALDERRRVIAVRRTFARKPERLAALGAEFGVSRERTRQLEANLRQRMEARTGELIDQAVRWLRVVVGPVAPEDDFRRALDQLVCDARPKWRAAAEVAVMNVGGYRVMDGVVGDAAFRGYVAEIRQRAPRFLDESRVIDEAALRDAIETRPAVPWEHAVRNAGLIRIRGRLVLRDTRRTRVALALDAAGRPLTRREIAQMADLPDNTTLSSLLSSEEMFVRLTKDEWGLAKWASEPYRGVVAEVVRRIEHEGGKARVEDLLTEIPERYGVLPATVRNYLATRKFVVKDGWVRVADRPRARRRSLSDARDVAWTTEGKPVLRFPAGEQHLRGNSQKISIAVAQHLGVGLDQSRRIPFRYPRGVAPASVIWRSYDPNGPELGCLREALRRVAIRPGEDVLLLLDRRGLRVLGPGAALLNAKP